MRQEATTLIDENKSLMTAIRLLNNELQTVLKADVVRCSRPSDRPDKKDWQLVGANTKKEKNKIRERNPEKNENEDAVIHLNDNNIQLASTKTIKVLQIRLSQLIRNPVLSSRVIRC